MVDPAGQFICPFLIMCMVSTPAMVILALQNEAWFKNRVFY